MKATSFELSLALRVGAPIALVVGLAASAVGADRLPPERQANLSFKLEIERAIERGNAWLAKQQDPETGAWGDATHPALTALPVAAAMSDPTRDIGAALPAHLVKGYDFLIGSRKSDGGIYGKGLAVYNTSLSVMALLLKEDPAVERFLLDARRFLINQQSDFDAKGEADNPLDGGVGYGGTYAHSDLSNTHFALEALYYSKGLLEETGTDRDRSIDLDWEAAIKFVSRCQNLTATNDEKWASDDPGNKGGFVYFPGDSKAGEETLDDGRVALRSYGSMSYAGLLSLVYADLERDDPRVVAVLDWLRRNYTLEENPGLEGQGLFYYYHTMAKSLRILGIETLELPDGKKVDWRRDLANRLFDLQRPDGSWVNGTGRWWENDPSLVTSYAVLTLAHIHRALP